MNELLFFGGAALIVGISYYLGFTNALNKNLKNEVRRFIHDMTVSQMAHDHFRRKAENDTKQFLKFLGVKNPKNIKAPKIMTPEQFDSENKK